MLGTGSIHWGQPWTMNGAYQPFQTSLYERVARDAVRADGVTVVRTWVYVAAPAVAARLRSGGELIEDGDWRRQRSS